MASTHGWDQFHTERATTSAHPHWPDTTMLKVVFGRYLAHPVRLDGPSRVLDVGCGFGNNLLPFARLGHQTLGVEISAEIVEVAMGFLVEEGYTADIRVGSNRQIPFEDDSVDLLLSLNTLHYETSREERAAALEEFARCLRPGGRLFLMTVGPGHDIRTTAEPIGADRYRIRNYDFRDGQIMCFFRGAAELDRALAASFTNVETGHITEAFMTRQQEFLLGSATAPER